MTYHKSLIIRTLVYYATIDWAAFRCGPGGVPLLTGRRSAIDYYSLSGYRL